MKTAVALLLLFSLVLSASVPSDAWDFPFPYGDFNKWWPNPNNFKYPTSVLCTDKGPCYKKKLTCPAKCTKTVTTKGKNGSSSTATSSTCSLDCKKCYAGC